MRLALALSLFAWMAAWPTEARASIFVNQTGLSDFYVEYQLNAHLESPHMRIPALAKLHANIQDTFNEAGITIVSPHYVADPESSAPS